jgi:outer membrane protein TolC
MKTLLITLLTPLVLCCSALSANLLTLQQAEAAALENNHDIQTLRHLLDRAKQGRLEDFSKWFPQIALVSQGYKTEKPDLFTKTRSVFLTQFYLTQALFSTNRYYNLRISALALQQIRALLEAIIIDVLYEARTAYYKIILDQETIETTQKNIELFAELAEKEERRYRIGTSILLNVNQSQVAVANATKAYYEAVKILKIDKDRLSIILGYNPGFTSIELPQEEIPVDQIPSLKNKLSRVESLFKPEGEDTLIFTKGFPATQELVMNHLFSQSEIRCWEKTALCYNPSLQAKEKDIRIANQEVNKDLGEYLPEVQLNVNYGGDPSSSTEFTSSNFNNQNFQWGVGVQLDWLLWDSFGREHKIKGARHERAARKQEYLKGIQVAYADVRKQIFNIEEAIANYVTSESNVKLANQTLELAKKQLEIGYITIFDYETVINNLIQAINIQNDARFELIRGYYGLIHASGADLIYCDK